jgi:hypothetical protein
MLVNHPYQVIYHIGGSDFTESRAFFFSLFLHAFCLVFFLYVGVMCTTLCMAVLSVISRLCYSL